VHADDRVGVIDGPAQHALELRLAYPRGDPARLHARVGDRRLVPLAAPSSSTSPPPRPAAKASARARIFPRRRSACGSAPGLVAVVPEARLACQGVELPLPRAPVERGQRDPLSASTRRLRRTSSISGVRDHGSALLPPSPDPRQPPGPPLRGGGPEPAPGTAAAAPPARPPRPGTAPAPPRGAIARGAAVGGHRRPPARQRPVSSSSEPRSSTQSLSATVIDTDRGAITARSRSSSGATCPSFGAPHGGLPPHADPAVKQSDPSALVAALERLLARSPRGATRSTRSPGVSGAGTARLVYLARPSRPYVQLRTDVALSSRCAAALPPPRPRSGWTAPPARSAPRSPPPSAGRGARGRPTGAARSSASPAADPALRQARARRPTRRRPRTTS
jgi:hypothetical protein